ncbi:COMM domain-containing protein 6 isoform X2 [Nerophis ophidion]|uniref:COMM domain-containing protein 6 isoform X2 n=1 Tax=Nerophis ophidion TaxID=159077 RepID=UPI002ADF016B|nr:COMM domain-containing protein 6 isoform X2 [Nerophis ophidion]
MPAMEYNCGTSNVVDIICRLNPDLLAEPVFQRAGVTLEHKSLQSITRFLLLTFRSAGKNKLSPDDLVSRLEESSKKWSTAALQVLRSLWSQHGESVQVQQAVQDMLSVGQLVDMQWKLGLAVSSDTCRSLNSPFVTILLKIAEPSGQINQKAFEMTVPQFQNFHKQMKEVAAVMETV